ncbi:hypothetical protein M758_3G263500, partial [Ceratodon purpureus]
KLATIGVLYIFQFNFFLKTLLFFYLSGSRDNATSTSNSSQTLLHSQPTSSELHPTSQATVTTRRTYCNTNTLDNRPFNSTTTSTTIMTQQQTTVCLGLFILSLQLQRVPKFNTIFKPHVQLAQVETQAPLSSNQLTERLGPPQKLC